MTIATIAQIAREHARLQPDRPALWAGGQTMTFGELDARSSQVAQALLADGVGAQDRIAYFGKGVPSFFEVFFGVAKLKAVNLSVNWRLAGREIAYVLNDSEAKVLIVGEEFVPILDAIEEELKTVKRIVVLGQHDRHVSYQAWASAHPAEDPSSDGAPGDVALQLYTSGTTGLPKGVMLTNKNVFAAVPAAATELHYNSESVNLVAMPLFHIGGVGVALIGFFVGCRTVLMPEVDLAQMLKLIVAQRVTHMFAVPAVLQFLTTMPGVQDMDFSALETVVYGASPISVDVLIRSMDTFGGRFIQTYGLTETHGTIARLLPEDHDPAGPNAHRLRSAGTPMPGVELRIVDAETSEDVAQGEVGEIWSRSSQNMLGYWGQPEETAKTITPDGWLRTGDAGYFDADGFLYIHDRIKDMIISGGENVYPAEVENVLMGHPAIADVAVIGVPSEKWGETVKAVVVAAEGQRPTPEQLIAYSRERLAHYKCPTSVDFVTALPRNPSGKILKRALRAPYL